MKRYFLIAVCLHTLLFSYVHGQEVNTNNCPTISKTGNGDILDGCELGSEKCTIKCKDNTFRLNGAATIECQNGHWSDDIGICEEIFCPIIHKSGKETLSEKCNLATPGDKCTIKCGGKTVLDGKESATCTNTGAWTNDIGICRDVHCVKPKVETGVTLTGDCDLAQPGDVCNVKCSNEKMKLIGSKSIQCTSSGKWSAKPGTCPDVKCPDLEIKKGVHDPGSKCSDAGPSDTCKIKCNDKLQNLNGESEATCTRNGVWSNDIGICEDIFCPNIQSTGFGRVIGDCVLAVPGSICKLDCDTKYRASGPKSAECMKPGIWNRDLGICKEKTCPSVENTGNQNLKGCGIGQLGAEIGSTCTITCHDKYKLDGSGSLKCLESGKWNRDPGNCQAIFCPNINKLDEISSLSEQCQMATPGDKCKIQCSDKDKYIIDGQESITCRKDGHWSGDIGICKEILCPRIEHTGKGTLLGQCSVAKPLESCTIDCGGDGKLRLNGEKEVKCETDGSWSSDLGICEEIFCPNIEDTGNAELQGQCKMAILGDSCKIKCINNDKRLFRIRGSETVKCQAEGFWSADLGFCEEIMCPNINPTPDVTLTGDCHFAKPGQTCKLSCGTTGKTLVGGSELNCRNDGRWSRYPGTCEVSCDVGYVKNQYGACIGVCEMAPCQNYGAQCVAEETSLGYYTRCVCPPTYLPFKENQTCTVGDKVYKLRLDGIKLEMTKTEPPKSNRFRRSYYLSDGYAGSEDKNLQIVEKKIRDAFLGNFKAGGMEDVKVENCSYIPYEEILLASCDLEMFYLNVTEEPSAVRDITLWIKKADGYLLLKPDLEVQKDIVTNLVVNEVTNPCDEFPNICESEDNECKKGEKPMEFSCPCKLGFEAIPGIPQRNKLFSSPVCKDINECESKNLHNCTVNENCINKVGSYRCECKEGFKYTNDSPLKCIGICDDKPCKNKGLCRANHLKTSFVCECPMGYSGEYCDIKAEKLSAAEMNNVVVGSVLGGLLFLSLGGSALVIARLRKKKNKVEHYEDPMQDLYTIHRPGLRAQLR